MGFAVHKGVGRSCGEVCNKRFVVYKGVSKGSNLKVKEFRMLFKEQGRFLP